MKFEVDPRYRLFYFPDRGFAQFKVTDKMLIINQICGDGKFWKQVAEVLASACGVNHLGTWCVRNVEVYIRFWGFTADCIEYLQKEDCSRYHCINKTTGERALISPAFKKDNGEWAYYVTWEI